MAQHGIEPWRYLNAVFAKLPAAKTEADIDALLPWRIALDGPVGNATRVSSS